MNNSNVCGREAKGIAQAGIDKGFGDHMVLKARVILVARYPHRDIIIIDQIKYYEI